MTNSGAEIAAAAPSTCAYCHLPLDDAPASEPGERYCCFGCRLAAEVAGGGGAQGALHWTLARLGIAIFLSLNVMMFTMALWSDDLYDARAVGSGALAAALADLFRYLCLLLSLPVLMLLGAPILDNAWHSSRRGAAAAADVLIVAGVGAAYVYSVISVLRGAGHVYFEVGCAVLVMVTLGRWLEAHGRLKTTAALDALEKLLPDSVRVVGAGGRDEVVATDRLRIGDRLRVIAGERIATDGCIITGQAACDEQMLTGESRPAHKTLGDSVLGGSLNLDGDLVVEVTSRPENSSLMRVVELVRQARLSKGRYQRAVDSVARVFLPIVIVIAAAAFLYHTRRAGVDQGVMAALAVLLIACPCALGLATSLATWVALGTASRAGVLLRSGEVLERLAAVRALRFDKTGTLTTGGAAVQQFVVDDPQSRHEVLRRAAVLAASSAHPFSAAIVDFARRGQDRGESPLTTSKENAAADIQTAAGRGVRGNFAAEASSTFLGSRRWLAAEHCSVPAEIARAADEAQRAGASTTEIGYDRAVRGLFVFAETIRSEARAALGACRALGCDVAVLTGDNAGRGRALAEQLDVAVQAELLPQDKLAALSEARRTQCVAMIGDGVNDAPALAGSDLGIAMGSGVDLARDSADVCLRSNDLLLIPWSIRLARQTRRVIHQNLFWAFLYNTIGIGFAATGLLNPAFAAAAMVVSSALVVSNSLRLGRDEPPHFAIEGHDETYSSAHDMAPLPHPTALSQ